MAVKLALVAGGTGGHLYPAIELARAWREQTGETPLILTRHGADADKVKAAGFEPACFLNTRPPQGKKDYPGYFLSLLKGAVAARLLLRQHGVTHLVGFGNYISASAMLLAPRHLWLAAHEANSVLGQANRRLLPRLSAMFLSFEDTLGQIPPAHRARAKVVGFPTRPPAGMSREEAKTALGLDANLPLLLVMGGSLGARRLNEVMLQWVGQGGAQALGVQVYWVCGERDEAWVRQSLASPPPGVNVVAYEHNMPLAWRAADMALTRAGAGTLFEAWAGAVPLVMVPFPFATHDHQTRNASEWARRFGCQLVKDEALSPVVLAHSLARWSGPQEEAAEAVRRAMRQAPPPDTTGLMLAEIAGVY